MKKAKIVLSAVALFAVVGGALAFKAQRFGAANVYTSYTTEQGGPVYCTLTTFKTTNIATLPLVQAYTGTTDNNVCLPAIATRITTTVLGE